MINLNILHVKEQDGKDFFETFFMSRTKKKLFQLTRLLPSWDIMSTKKTFKITTEGHEVFQKTC